MKFHNSQVKIDASTGMAYHAITNEPVAGNNTILRPGEGECFLYDMETDERLIRNKLDAKEAVKGNPARYSLTPPPEAA